MHYRIIYSVFIYFIFSLKRLHLKRNIYEPNSTNGLELGGKQQQQTNNHLKFYPCLVISRLDFIPA